MEFLFSDLLYSINLFVQSKANHTYFRILLQLQWTAIKVSLHNNDTANKNDMLDAI